MIGEQHSGAGSLIEAETFTSLQGEGPSAGQPAAFIRLSRCNLACSFCDTPYTWDWARFSPDAEAARRSPAALVAWVLAQRLDLLVITGGEPLIQQAALVPLTDRLAEATRIETETNGTIAPLPQLAERVSTFNVSPKLSGSGMQRSQRLIPAALVALQATGKAVFKFVICDPVEIPEVAALELEYGLSPIWLMPEGRSEEPLLEGLRTLAGEALAHGWGLSGRLQILLWGDERGR